jgi:hypothetical protein
MNIIKTSLENIQIEDKIEDIIKNNFNLDNYEIDKDIIFKPLPIPCLAIGMQPCE